MVFAAKFPTIIISVNLIIIAGQISIYDKSMFSAEKLQINGSSLSIAGNPWDVNASAPKMKI